MVFVVALCGLLRRNRGIAPVGKGGSLVLTMPTIDSDRQRANGIGLMKDGVPNND